MVKDFFKKIMILFIVLAISSATINLVEADREQLEYTNEIDGVLTTNSGQILTLPTKISTKTIPTEDARCGVLEDLIVCQTHKRTDSELFCWGKGESRTCPENAQRIIESSQEQDLRLQISSEGEGEIEVLSWSWGVSSQGFEDDDSDQVEIRYVWLAKSEPRNSDDRPSETLSLSFTKIELTTPSGVTFQTEYEARTRENSLSFATITLTQTQDTSCSLNQIFTIGDCDDHDVEITPEAQPQIPIEETCPEGQELTTRGDVIRCEVTPSDVEETTRITEQQNETVEDEQIQAIAARRDKATPALAKTNLSKGINPNSIDESNKKEIREYLASKQELRGQDFGLAIALAASNNSRIREIRYNNKTSKVEIDHDEELRLFGLIKMNARATTAISENGETTTNRPWWATLATKPKENIIDYLDLDSDGDGIIEAATGRNPQTGKEIQIAAKN